MSEQCEAATNWRRENVASAILFVCGIDPDDADEHDRANALQAADDALAAMDAILDVGEVIG